MVWSHDLPNFKLEMTVACHCGQLLLFEMGSWELFAQVGFEVQS
jgi:hypothetical protein